MNGPQTHFHSLDLGALDRLANVMLRHLPCPMVIGLTGTLGAGKTTLVQRLAHAAEIDEADVTSPTFTLLQTHHGSITMHHLDAYRVADEEEFLQLGVEELFEDDCAWTMIEWADRVRDVLPKETLWVALSQGKDHDTRDVTLHTSDPILKSALQQIQTDFSARE